MWTCISYVYFSMWLPKAMFSQFDLCFKSLVSVTFHERYKIYYRALYFEVQ